MATRGKDILLLTKKQQIQLAIARIHFEHRYDEGIMFGTLSAEDAKCAYQKLALHLPRIPGLTDEERIELMEEIQERIEQIPEVEAEKQKTANESPEKSMDVVSKDILFKLKVDQVRDRIAKIHYAHHCFDDGRGRALTQSEAEYEYVKLMGFLYTIPDITPNERDMLAKGIQKRIDKIPEVEAEKKAEYEEIEAKLQKKRSTNGIFSALRRLIQKN